MNRSVIKQTLGISILVLILGACVPSVQDRSFQNNLPGDYHEIADTTNEAETSWKLFFQDEHLVSLIDTALAYNQEYNILMQEINAANSEVLVRKGEYLPTVGVGVNAGAEKVGRYTSQGANDANTEIEPGKEFPEPLGDFRVGLEASWEIDVWRKLRNSRDAAINRYLASIEGKNFMVTNLVSEIAMSYYELLALDSQLDLIKEYIDIQQSALKIVKLQKSAGEVTELAVKKFEAEVLSSQSMKYDILQQITVTENRVNFLLGRFPQPIERSMQTFDDHLPDTLDLGVPSELLQNRPDIRQAEYILAASRLDVKAARAEFFPSVRITTGVGFSAFNPAYFTKAPESLAYSVAGDLIAPLINRRAIKGRYFAANSRQIQAVYEYERVILNAYIEVINQLASIHNLKQGYDLKAQEVQVLTKSISVANDLFKSAKADYMEVLLTQRDALEARFELIEYRKNQLVTNVSLYRALGGGWK